MKRLKGLSIVLAVVMLFISAGFTPLEVYGLEKSGYLFYDNFDYSQDISEINGLATCRYNTIIPTLSGGKVEWPSNTTTGTAVPYFYFKSDKSDIISAADSGRVAFEFDIWSNTSTVTPLFLTNSTNESNTNDNSLMQLRVVGGQIRQAYDGQTANNISYDATSTTSVRIVMDFDNYTYDLYTNGVLRAEGYGFWHGDTIKNVTSLRFNSNANGPIVRINKVKVYKLDGNDKYAVHGYKDDSGITEIPQDGIFTINGEIINPSENPLSAKLVAEIYHADGFLKDTIVDEKPAAASTADYPYPQTEYSINITGATNGCYVKAYLWDSDTGTKLSDDVLLFARSNSTLALEELEGLILGANPDFDRITQNMNLPVRVLGYDEVVISWTSSKPDVIASDGTVTRPSGNNDETVLLTATATDAAGTDGKTFTCIVKTSSLYRYGDYLFYDNFDYAEDISEVSGLATCRGKVLMPTLNNGEVEWPSNNTSGVVVPYFYFNGDKTPIASASNGGKVAFEFDIWSNNSTNTPLFLTSSSDEDNSNSGTLMQVRVVSGQIRQAFNGQTSTNMSYDATATTSVRIVLDFDTYQYDLYTNGVLRAKNYGFYNGDAVQSVTALRFNLNANAGPMVRISNVRVYEVDANNRYAFHFHKENSGVTTIPEDGALTVKAEVRNAQTTAFPAQLVVDVYNEDGTLKETLKEVKPATAAVAGAGVGSGDSYPKTAYSVNVTGASGCHIRASLQNSTTNTLLLPPHTLYELDVLESWLLGTNEDFHQVTQNLNLITALPGMKDTLISWKSDKEDVISANGTVVRPTGIRNQRVTLTATLKDLINPKITETKDFIFTVLTTYALPDSTVLADFTFTGKTMDDLADMGITKLSNNAALSISPEGNLIVKKLSGGESTATTQTQAVRFSVREYDEENPFSDGNRVAVWTNRLKGVYQIDYLVKAKGLGTDANKNKLFSLNVGGESLLASSPNGANFMFGYGKNLTYIPTQPSYTTSDYYEFDAPTPPDIYDGNWVLVRLVVDTFGDIDDMVYIYSAVGTAKTAPEESALVAFDNPIGGIPFGAGSLNGIVKYDRAFDPQISFKEQLPKDAEMEIKNIKVTQLEKDVDFSTEYLDTLLAQLTMSMITDTPQAYNKLKYPLPTQVMINGRAVPIEWSSSNPGLVSHSGAFLGTNEDKGEDVYLTAKINDGVFEKNKTFKLTMGQPGTDSLAPTASNVKISGNNTVGSTLSLSYTFYNANGGSDYSEVVWQASYGSSFYDISGATGKNYVIQPSDAGKTIRAKVFPRNSEMIMGTAVTSNAIEVLESSNGGGGSSGGGGRGGSVNFGNTPSNIPPIGVEPAEPDKDNHIAGFKDVPANHWAASAIETLAKLEIISGDGNGHYNPYASLTREQFAKIITMAFSAFDGEANVDFTDIAKSSWSYGYIASLHKHGIVLGDDNGAFHPYDFITRENMAVMIWRAAEEFDIKLPQIRNAEFGDIEDVAGYARYAVTKLAGAGVINGSDGNFNPKDFCTRAEAAKMVYEAYKQILSAQ